MPKAPAASTTAVPPIVGIGASAGGLEAFRHFLAAVQPGSGMAFILVQHLDPSHESLLVELLTPETALSVQQAVDGMLIEPEHLYVIPPGRALAVRGGILRLSRPEARHGARLPFDFLLHSLAVELGARAMAVVLSGTGADGSLGALAVRAAGGYVVAQEPSEAGFDGMPRSTISAGGADVVLPAAAIHGALLAHLSAPTPTGDAHLLRIVELLRTRTAHNFTLYKPGTLRRRIERRVAIAGATGLDAYIKMLESDPGELAQLAKDLLIHVTGFFRDPAVFKLLRERVLPDLVRSHATPRSLRVWVAGCSTGEEAWSIAMVLSEIIEETGRDTRLRIFASDVDADAVAVARHGLYPASIASEVSAERLARFFQREGDNWRVSQDLRSTVVFAVQDVLADPPFARLDLVSCRNLLIYLRPEAQSQVIALFHFALRTGGILLLGTSETLGQAEGGFEPVAGTERVWRRLGQTRAPDPGFAGFAAAASQRGLAKEPSQPRQARLAELCQRLVLASQAPAAVLIDQEDRCLYSLGPIERYLGHAPGAATHDLFALARPVLRAGLRSAVHQARKAGQPITVDSGPLDRDGSTMGLRLDIRPAMADGEKLLLICFLEQPAPGPGAIVAAAPADALRVAALERELEATRAELRGAIHAIELANEEQRSINEEALSVNEEFQSTTEELLTSKEELQSLNEELTVLNGQLQETLERSRTTTNDLQNVLFSTNVATLFIDASLHIRFFTPPMRVMFHLLPGDIGRPLADLRPVAADPGLLDDAAAVLAGSTVPEHEIEAPDQTWLLRRVLPYRAQDGATEGVVITFADITERKRIAGALQGALRLAETATAAKSRFLAAASHDLRQPLQTLTLLQGLLAKAAREPEEAKLVALLDPPLTAMTGMLNTLLDINQIEAGTLRPDPVRFPVGPMLSRLREEFAYLAAAQGLELRVMPCHLAILTDPRLFEQILRNLLSNALKYTPHGRVLLGCRRRQGMLSIEVWDTGIGIADKDLQAVFDAYRQVGPAAAQHARGLGLGLSIVQQLAKLLDHRLRVRSVPGRGSVFAVEAPVAATIPDEDGTKAALPAAGAEPAATERAGEILVVEDAPDVRDLLVRVLTAAGHRAVAAASAPEAMALVARGAIRPDLVLADFNLPDGMDGLQLGAQLRRRLHAALPVLILTADIATETLREIASQECEQVHKPVKPVDLVARVQRLLLSAPRQPLPPAPPAMPDLEGTTIHVVEDDALARGLLRRMLEKEGHAVRDYATAEAFLAASPAASGACLLLDAHLPGMSGFALLDALRGSGNEIPAIMITGYSDVQAAVQAMKAGAADFIEKPVQWPALLAGIARALELGRDKGKVTAWQEAAARRIATLTPRQHQIMDQVLAGAPSKNIAADLGISQRTVESHRATIMQRTGAKSLPELARLAVAAASGSKAMRP